MVRLPRIQTVNLWDRAYTILKENIIKREFRAGEKLLITDLVKQLGISSTPIRDAIIRLESEGLITKVPKVGTFINSITAEDVNNTMDTRLMLECWVADRLGRLGKAQLKAAAGTLLRVVDTALHSLESAPIEEYVSQDYNFQFHVAYMKLGGNAKNVEIYRRLMNYREVLNASTTESRDTKLAAIAQHRSIAESVQSGSTREVKRAVTAHLEGSKGRLLKLIEENGGAI